MEHLAHINFQEARDFGSTMNVTYRFIRQNLKGLGKSLLFFAAPAVLLGSVFYHEIISRMLNLARTEGMSGAVSPFGADEYFTSASFWITLFAALVFMLIGGVFTVSTTHAYILVYQERQTPQVDLSEVWKRSRGLFVRTFTTMFMYYMGMSTAMGMLLIPVGLLVFVTGLISPLLSGISMILYYVGLLVLCIYFAMLFFIRNKERIGFFPALSRLTNISKGKFWNTILVGGINTYIQIVFSLLFMLPWYIYFLITYLHDVSTTPLASPGFLQETLSTIMFMIYSISSIVLAAIPLIALAVQYYSLSERSESKGLLERIESFGQELHVEQSHEDY